MTRDCCAPRVASSKQTRCARDTARCASSESRGWLRRQPRAGCRRESVHQDANGFFDVDVKSAMEACRQSWRTRPSVGRQQSCGLLDRLLTALAFDEPAPRLTLAKYATLRSAISLRASPRPGRRFKMETDRWVSILIGPLTLSGATQRCELAGVVIKFRGGCPFFDRW